MDQGVIWNGLNNAGSIAGLVGVIAVLANKVISRERTSARLDRATKILTECQNYMETMKTQNYDLIMDYQPTFIETMTQNLHAYVQESIFSERTNPHHDLELNSIIETSA